MLTPWLLFTPRRAPDLTTARHKLAFPFMYAKSSTAKQTTGRATSHWAQAGPAKEGRTEPWRPLLGKSPWTHRGPAALVRYPRGSAAASSQGPGTAKELQGNLSSRRTLVCLGLQLQGAEDSSGTEGSGQTATAAAFLNTKHWEDKALSHYVTNLKTCKVRTEGEEKPVQGTRSRKFFHPMEPALCADAGHPAGPPC